MVSRVAGAIEAHDRAVEAQRKLRAELEAHPDVFEFKFRNLIPRMEKFNSAVPVMSDQLSRIEGEYRAITAKMADYLGRKRQFAGLQDYRSAGARNQISVALMLAPNSTNQTHFRAEAIQRDFDLNGKPLKEQVSDLKPL